MCQPLIFHIDVNSAFLSWTAVEKQKHGAGTDLREIPSIIGGDMASRHGVVLAKSIPAKAYGIHTGEPVAKALAKCPGLVLEPPDHALYARCSRSLMELLATFSPAIEQASIDECFMDFTGQIASYDSPKDAATQIKDEVLSRFGYTVNIGISTNKLLAKMASDFQKPNRVHTLFPEEVPLKMWPLPVEDLYMVGRSTVRVLHKLEIATIGELANTDPEILASHLKSHGRLIWEYANGIDDSPVATEESERKCVGNSITLPKDADTAQEARQALRGLCDQVARRLQKKGQLAGMVSIELKYATFLRVSHQKQLPAATYDSKKLYDAACALFNELWNGEPIRLLGVRTSKLIQESEPTQMSLADLPHTQKEIRMDRAMDKLRQKYGDGIVKKGWK